jgi:hypothetical protein
MMRLAASRSAITSDDDEMNTRMSGAFEVATVITALSAPGLAFHLPNVAGQSPEVGRALAR